MLHPVERIPSGAAKRRSRGTFDKGQGGGRPSPPKRILLMPLQHSAILSVHLHRAKFVNRRNR